MVNIIKLLIILSFSLSVAACGKMADPDKYEGSGYPHSYPRR